MTHAADISWISPRAPSFGVQSPGVAYKFRPGAYGILRDPCGRLAVVRTPGGVFLPGGGADPQESASDALAREVREELGLACQDLTRVAEAVEYVRGRDGDFALLCAYFTGSLPDAPFAGREPDHVGEWLPVAEAIAQLHRPAQTWAVRKACGVP